MTEWTRWAPISGLPHGSKSRKMSPAITASVDSHPVALFRVIHFQEAVTRTAHCEGYSDYLVDNATQICSRYSGKAKLRFLKLSLVL